jgi:hypothetical protein
MSELIIDQTPNLFWAITICHSHKDLVHPRNPYQSGKLSTVDLLVLTSLDELLLIMKKLSTFLQNKLP